MPFLEFRRVLDRKSTRLNSSHTIISYAVFCLKKKKEADGSFAGFDATELYDKGGGAFAVFCPSALSVNGFGDFNVFQGASSGLFFFLIIGPPPKSTLFPTPPLFS